MKPRKTSARPKPYGYPRISSFGKLGAVSQAKSEIRLIRKELRDHTSRLKITKNPEWLSIRSRKSAAQIISRSPWLPKLYVCVAPKDYWRAIRKLIELSVRFPLNWKFCANASSLQRPDKIVLYFNTVPQLKRSLPKIRTALAGLRFHGFSNAASTVEMGFETEGRGIYVGADPSFLKRASWRFYRCSILMGIKSNRNYFQEVARKQGLTVIELFNLSAKHEGPLRFSSSKSQTDFIREVWKSIF